MPIKRKPKKHKRADYYRPFIEKQQQARRGMCSWLKFWKACGHKKCLRARACVADVDGCFHRLWPIVPEWLKMTIRVAAKAAAQHLSPPERAAAIKRDMARWHEMMAQQEARAATQASAEPPPQSAPIVPAEARVIPVPAPRIRPL